MPGPAGVVILGPGAVAAAKHLAFQVATSVDVTTFASATTLTVLFCWCFSKLPDWVRNDLSYRNLLRNRQGISKEEITGLLSVVDKIQELAKSIKELHNVADEIPQLHAAVLAFIQVSGQLKLQQINNVKNNLKRRRQKTKRQRQQQQQRRRPQRPQDEETRDDEDDDDGDIVSTEHQQGSSTTTTTTPRDSSYQSAGDTIDINELRCEELQTALTMSTWAYYEDSMVRFPRFVVRRILRLYLQRGHRD
jgi:hypothetical protein